MMMDKFEKLLISEFIARYGHLGGGLGSGGENRLFVPEGVFRKHFVGRS